jgi:hypothetical protein
LISPRFVVCTVNYNTFTGIALVKFHILPPFIVIAVEFDLNAGHTCNTGFLPLISNWQDCKQAAESLGFNGDNVNHVDYNGGWGTNKPQGCFQSDGNGRIHFNEGSGGNSVGTDKILCKAG